MGRYKLSVRGQPWHHGWFCLWHHWLMASHINSVSDRHGGDGDTCLSSKHMGLLAVYLIHTHRNHYFTKAYPRRSWSVHLWYSQRKSKKYMQECSVSYHLYRNLCIMIRIVSQLIVLLQAYFWYQCNEFVIHFLYIPWHIGQAMHVHILDTLSSIILRHFVRKR